ncbi:MAG TPA: hypothetical protein VHF22_14635 [Planctomycetota bacterium]|nr:hypothetical protein [Planctomycetota bacterium]
MTVTTEPRTSRVFERTVLAAIAAGVIVCAAFAIRLGLHAPRPFNPKPSPFMEKFSPKDFILEAFQIAQVNALGSGDLEPCATWFERHQQLWVRADGLPKDGNGVADALRRRLDAALAAAHEPQKIGRSAGGGSSTEALETFEMSRAYAFEKPSRCVGHVSVRAVRATSPTVAPFWTFFVDVIEDAQ